MPSPEKSYSAEGYRVFTKGPVPEIEEDLSERSRRDPQRTRRLQESANLSEKDSNFGRYGLNSVPIGAFFSRSLQYVVTTKMSQLA